MWSRDAWRRSWIFIGPLLFSPLLHFGPEARCAFCILIVSSFWITDVLPAGVVSLLPLFLFPIFNIVPSKEIGPTYFKDSVVLFVTTLIMALAVEETNLHRRIALKLLCLVGAQKQRMLFGFMCTTAFISFFVSDTACTALMCPIALAILRIMHTAERAVDQPVDDHVIGDELPSEYLQIDSIPKQQRGFCKALLLACAHGSLIGGTAIITSTGPNLVFREIIHTQYPSGIVDVSYLQWMTFAMPPMIFYLIASYIVMTCVFLGPLALFSCFKSSTEDEKKSSEIVEKNISLFYEDLGPITFGEKSVFGWFCVLLAAWILRAPGFCPGWGDLLPMRGSMVTDTAPAIAIAAILFIWPRKCPSKDEEWTPILNWNTIQRKFSWSSMFLIGAGYAISEAVQRSGLSVFLSCFLKKLTTGLSSIWLQLVVTSCITFTTEFVSNVSTGSILIPIVISVAESIGVHPLSLALPTTVACSFAFMLPMATPPNAVVYSTGCVSMMEMITTGIFLNILCICITVINMNTWTYWLFQFDHIPPVPYRNATLMC